MLWGEKQKRSSFQIEISFDDNLMYGRILSQKEILNYTWFDDSKNLCAVVSQNRSVKGFLARS